MSRQKWGPKSEKGAWEWASTWFISWRAPSFPTHQLCGLGPRAAKVFLHLPHPQCPHLENGLTVGVLQAQTEVR